MAGENPDLVKWDSVEATKFDEIDMVLVLLNRAFAADPEAMEKLQATQVECNEKLAHDPTIQVNGYSVPGKYYVGFLGIVNGIVKEATVRNQEESGDFIAMEFRWACVRCGLKDIGENEPVPATCGYCGKELKMKAVGFVRMTSGKKR